MPNWKLNVLARANFKATSCVQIKMIKNGKNPLIAFSKLADKAYK